ncbi:MAG: formate--tetrahydrofolate ligase [Thermoplasmata archaeon]|nr:formate--tetrahydrofolate ligase [Thermoplasmata archaeon]
MRTLEELCKELGVDGSEVRPVGRGIGKLSVAMIRRRAGSGPRGRLLLITGMTPTSHGEGKTVTTIGTAMALRRAGHSAVAVLRQPSLGPVFGVKGGATGGGKATVEPSDLINFGFTGDLHAAAAAHNLLSALLNNHLYHDNELGLDPARIRWPWTVDMEDRALRHVTAQDAGKRKSVHRESRFVITAASEVTAILGLARDYLDLKERLGRIIVGTSTSGRLIRATDLQAEGAMAALLRDALEPNLVQCADGTPALVHGGPFGNIAHGTASRLAIEFGLAAAEYCVVEAGFAADLGAEKFVDIVARDAGLSVSAGLVVTTVRGLRHQGGVEEEQLAQADPAAVTRGIENLHAHLDTLHLLGVPSLVVLNRFPDDSGEEVEVVRAAMLRRGTAFAESTVFSDGSEGAPEVARHATRLAASGGVSAPLYPSGSTIPAALDTLVTQVYGAEGADWTAGARQQLDDLEASGEARVPICVAKTSLSLSDDPKKLGRPGGYRVTVRRIERSAGAGFTVVFLGEIETMPGLPKRPLAERIDLLADGRIVGTG